MLFQEEHIEQIREGEKTQTRRDWASPQATAGNVYIASTELLTSHEEADCYIRVLDIRKEALGEITPYAAEREGGYTVEEFREVWREINGEWEPHKTVTVVEFEYAGREHPEHSETDQPTLQEAA